MTHLHLMALVAELRSWPSPTQGDALSASVVADMMERAAQAISTLTAEVEELRADRVRYQWLADAVLYCDHGDNEHGGSETPDRIGWGIRHSRRNAEPFIFGQSIDAAIDATLTKGEGDKTL